MGIGTGGSYAALTVNKEGLQGKALWLGHTNSFVNTAGYHYTDARLAISGRDADGTDRGAGIEFTSRNTAGTNWLHGYLVHGRDGSVKIGTGGAGAAQAAERMRIDSSGNLLVGTTHQE